MIAHYFSIGYCMMMYEMWPLLLQMMLFDRCAQLFCVRLIFCLTLCCHQMFAQLNRISTIARNGKSTNKCEANEKKNSNNKRSLNRKKKRSQSFQLKTKRTNCVHESLSILLIYAAIAICTRFIIMFAVFEPRFFFVLFKGVDKKPWRFGFFCQ